MRFLCDEDTDADVADYLSKAGHDVERAVTVDEVGSGAADSEVMEYARAANRIILTHDDDFVDPRIANQHCGVFYAPDQRMPAIELYRVISGIVDACPSRNDMPPVVFLTDDWL